MRLSFTITTIILGLAAALILAIGVRTVLLPWSEGVRSERVQGLLASMSMVPARSARVPDDAVPAPAAEIGGLSSPKPDRSNEGPLIGSRNSKHYHRANCSYVQSISPGNRIELKSCPGSRESGLKPCGYCLGGAVGQSKDRQP